MAQVKHEGNFSTYIGAHRPPTFSIDRLACVSLPTHLIDREPMVNHLHLELAQLVAGELVVLSVLLIVGRAAITAVSFNKQTLTNSLLEELHSFK